MPKSKKPVLKFYVCNKCSRYHFIYWGGDCKEPHRAFDQPELAKAYGPKGWEVVPDPYHAVSH